MTAYTGLSAHGKKQCFASFNDVTLSDLTLKTLIFHCLDTYNMLECFM